MTVSLITSMSSVSSSQDGTGAYLHVHLIMLPLCDQQALHLVKEMDHDGDGKISEAEVLKNQESFMNSEVTDYGRQLNSSHDEL